MDAIKKSDEGNLPLRAFIDILEHDVLKQAEASAKRWHSGQQHSVLDGVPVAVKDEVDQLPYPRAFPYNNTRFSSNTTGAKGEYFERAQPISDRRLYLRARSKNPYYR
jgi:hypothetical protein